MRCALPPPLLLLPPLLLQCKVPVGTPSSQHYDTNCNPSERPPGYPYWQVAVPSGNRFEYGGDGGTPEIGLAALDHWYYSQDASVLADHLPLASLAATVREDEGGGRITRVRAVR